MNTDKVYFVGETEFNTIISNLTRSAKMIDKDVYTTMFFFSDHSYACLTDTLVTIYSISHKILGSFWKV